MGFGVVDGADMLGQGRRGATVALVHPASVTHSAQLSLHVSSQVALGPVVQGIHAAGRPCFSVWDFWCFD